MTFSDILTALGSYAFPIVVTIYLLWERQTYIKDQTKILQELKETIVILNENITNLKLERGETNGSTRQKKSS